jgi:hypothetical protein
MLTSRISRLRIAIIAASVNSLPPASGTSPSLASCNARITQAQADGIRTPLLRLATMQLRIRDMRVTAVGEAVTSISFGKIKIFWPNGPVVSPSRLTGKGQAWPAAGGLLSG